MRILLISDYATPTGGAEHVMLGLRTALRERGHEVRFLASTARPLGQESQADYHCFGLMSKARGLVQVWNPSAYRQLKSILEEFQPDVVHVRLFLSQISPSILPLLRHVPTIFHAAWYRTICPLGTKLLPDGQDCHEAAGLACVRHQCIPFYTLPTVTLQMWLTRRGWPAFDHVVANSHATRQVLEEQGVPVDQVIWNGVVSSPQGQPDPRFPIVAFAGRLVWEKGTDLLIQAFARILPDIPHARLWIAGDGPERANLETLATQLGIEASVDFLGMLPRDEMNRRFGVAWVQAVPSRWREPFGLVAAEALMRGTPALVSDSGGLAEIVEHGVTGCRTPSGDLPALTETLRNMLRDPVRLRQMGLRARAFALQNLDQRIFVDHFIDLYQALQTPAHDLERAAKAVPQ